MHTLPDFSRLIIVPVRHTPVLSTWPLLSAFNEDQRRMLPVPPAENALTLFHHHIAAMQEAYDDRKTSVIILQDNCIPAVEDWHQKAGQMFSTLQHLPWGQIVLRGGQAPANAMRVIGTDWIVLPFGSIHTFAYIIRRPVIEIFLKKFAPRGQVNVPKSSVLPMAITNAVHEARLQVYTPVQPLLRRIKPDF